MISLRTCCFFFLTVTSVTGTQAARAPCPERDVCIRDLDMAKANKHNSDICNYLRKSHTCFEDLATTCPASSTAVDASMIEIYDLQMKSGCTTPCAQEAEQCLAAVSDMMNINRALNSTVCKDINEMLDCLDGLNSTDCSHNVEALLKFVTKDFMNEDYDNICGPRGGKSGCFSKMNKCMSPLNDINNHTLVNETCLAIDKFLQCETGDECQSHLKTYKERVMNQLETEETTIHCPTKGSCWDRIKKCSAPSDTFFERITEEKESSSKVCKDYDISMDCIKTVKKDPVCNDTIVKFGELFVMTYNLECTTAGCLDKLNFCSSRTDMILRYFYPDGKDANKLCQSLNSTLHCYNSVRKEDELCSRHEFNLTEKEVKYRNMTLTKCPEAYCRHRMDDCAKPVMTGLTRWVPIEKHMDQVCTSVNESITCFDSVRNDPECFNETTTFGKDELKVRKLAETKCAAAYCRHRMDDCAKPVITGLTRWVPIEKHMDQVCTSVKPAMNCFDITRKDPLCVNNTSTVSVQEAKIRHLSDTECVAAYCRHRMDDCAKPVMTGLTRWVPIEKHMDQICTSIKSAMNCFDITRKDPLCVKNTATVSANETQIRNVADAKCDAASIALSTALIGIGTLLYGLKNLL